MLLLVAGCVPIDLLPVLCLRSPVSRVWPKMVPMSRESNIECEQFYCRMFCYSCAQKLLLSKISSHTYSSATLVLIGFISSTLLVIPFTISLSNSLAISTAMATSVRLLCLASFASALLVLCLLAYFFNNNDEPTSVDTKPCRRRSFGQDSFVCVCSAEYCDQPEPLDETELDEGQLVFYVTSKAEHRLSRFVAEEEEASVSLEGSADFTVRVDPSQRFQSILGFGSSFTDSASLNANSLSDEARQKLLAAYFDPEEGIGYSLGRVPIGASDFSVRGYTYLDTPDNFNLSTFALAPEDLEQKIPLILKANRLAKGSLLLVGSPWTAPSWMKTNGQLRKGGELKGPSLGPYYQTWANYFARFLEEYAARGVHFWAISIQNEPELARMNSLNHIPTMFMTNLTQRDFARELLSPALKQTSAGKNVKILACDDMRAMLLPAAREIYSEPDKAEAIDGMAFHWYGFSPFAELSEVHSLRPDKLLISTEACTGLGTGPQLGDWSQGWTYAWDILNSLKHWSIGWIDWNFCLDAGGGPNWVNNFVDSPIIVQGAEFYKQPMFYAMAHFSRFVGRDSVRIGSVLYGADGQELEDTFEAEKMIMEKYDNSSFYPPMPSRHQPEHIAFQTPEGNFVLVLINQQNSSTEAAAENARMVRVRDEHSGRSWLLPFGSDSIVTAVWRRQKPVTVGGSDRSNL